MNREREHAGPHPDDPAPIDIDETIKAAERLMEDQLSTQRGDRWTKTLMGRLIQIINDLRRPAPPAPVVKRKPDTPRKKED